MNYQELITEEEYEQQLKELNDKRTRYLLAWQNSETEEQKNTYSAKLLEIDNLITDLKRRYQESCEFEKKLDEIAGEMLLESQYASHGPVLGM
ncbi:MAG: hypothetical protein J6K43_06215 [Lachnospiraceae bacterium]|nr:hypothetical protein [Lachnospiraceae bacterium]